MNDIDFIGKIEAFVTISIEQVGIVRSLNKFENKVEPCQKKLTTL